MSYLHGESWQLHLWKTKAVQKIKANLQNDIMYN